MIGVHQDRVSVVAKVLATEIDDGPEQAIYWQGEAAKIVDALEEYENALLTAEPVVAIKARQTGGVAEIERRLLSQVAERPRYASEYVGLKVVIDRLVAKGCLVRAKAPGSKFPMLIEITAAGRERLVQMTMAA